MGIQSGRYRIYIIQSCQFRAWYACFSFWFYDLHTNSSLLAHQTTATTFDTPKNIQPPEALTRRKIDLKSDVWTLGCTVSFIISTTLLFRNHAHRRSSQPDISPPYRKAPLRRIICRIARQCRRRNAWQARESPH